jgi:RNA polymerase sigma-70 factor, ECF subfamily
MSPRQERRFAELASRHRDALVGAARRRLGERSDEAEDVVQEALIRALRALRAGKEPGNEAAWLHAIVANCCVDRHRAAARRATAELDEQLAAPADVHAGAVVRGELRHTVAALRALPAAQRDALVGVALEGRSYEDVGLHHGWSLSATKSLVWRARSRLTEQRRAWAGVALPLFAPLRALAGGLADRPAAAGLLGHFGGEAAQCVAAVALVGVAIQVPAVPRGHREAVAAPPAAAVGHATAAPGPGPAPAGAGSHGAAPTGAAPSAATATDPRAVVTACRTSAVLPPGFTIAALSAAKRNLAADDAEYTDCSAKIDSALLRPPDG